MNPGAPNENIFLQVSERRLYVLSVLFLCDLKVYILNVKKKCICSDTLAELPNFKKP